MWIATHLAYPVGYPSALFVHLLPDPTTVDSNPFARSTSEGCSIADAFEPHPSESLGAWDRSDRAAERSDRGVNGQGVREGERR